MQKLIQAYRTLEDSLRQYLEAYLQYNNRVSDLILAESDVSSFNKMGVNSDILLPSFRRRSITPPGDYSRSTTMTMTATPVMVASDKVQNGSSLTISSMASSNSSNTTNNSSSNNFLSKHRFLPRISNTAQKVAQHIKNATTKSSSKDNVAKTGANESKGSKKTFFPLPFGSLSSLKRSESTSDIPTIPQLSIEHLSSAEQRLLSTGQEMAYQKRSMQHRKLSDVSIMPRKDSDNLDLFSSSPARHSDNLNLKQSKNILPPEKMIVNTLYFDNLDHPEAAISSNGPVKTQNINELLSNCESPPPPLPPKKVGLSMAPAITTTSSTRSSLASNVSSNSSFSFSKDCRHSLTNDSDSGLGFCDIPKEPISQTKSIHSDCGTSSNQSATQAPTQIADFPQVTLRPKKTLGPAATARIGCVLPEPRAHVCHCCHCHCSCKCSAKSGSASPPPLPSPETFLYSMESSQTNPPLPCDDNANKENCNIQSRCSHQSSRHGHSVRSPRRVMKPPSMTRTLRSYSIADTSTSTLKTSYLDPSTCAPMAHSTSFPHRLSHSVSNSDGLAPPPLPPKRRNMHEYMIMLGNYSGPAEPFDLFRYSQLNLSKSFDHNTAVRQGSVSSSVMSLSSSTSSNSSLSVHSNVSQQSAVAALVGDSIEKQQYLHLPIAPPPPTTLDASVEPPPVLPPRRDKNIELAVAPPIPPPVPSSHVQATRTNKQQLSQNSQQTPPTWGPRSSTPLSINSPCSETNPSLVQTQTQSHVCTCQVHSCADATSPTVPSVVVPTISVPDHEYREAFVEIEEESQEEYLEKYDSPTSESDEDIKILVDDPSCPHCSDGTVHSEDDCILAQIDIPSHLLDKKLPEDDVDECFGEVDIRGGSIDALVIKATQATSSGGKFQDGGHFLVCSQALVVVLFLQWHVCL